MNVVAFDLSLTCTGVADINGTRTIKPKTAGVARLREIRDAVIRATHVGDQGSGPRCFRCMVVDDPEDYLYGAHPEVVAIEGYSFGSPNRATALGELGGVVRLALWEADIRYIDVPPAAIKKYATGKGNGTKDDVYGEAIRRLDYAGSSKDESDALWLRALVLDALGEPVVTVPAKNREAVAVVAKLLGALEVAA